MKDQSGTSLARSGEKLIGFIVNPVFEAHRTGTLSLENYQFSVKAKQSGEVYKHSGKIVNRSGKGLQG
ncbi:hypothetical protein AMTR_s00146p00100100 [Amborella trichopoda]|uniref:Uncharacterized protein n=1 Tax=Amborella trichopoda TaxID=13333 RepID=W1PAZ9_AMBTC|nr:hypothetical protein AMTR_s00146p00100100 [Amborella trichopoda]